MYAFQPHRILTTLFFCLSCVTAKPQAVKVDNLNIRHGLSQGYISCLHQDREGFIWAGTKNGLNRFDGYRFETFTNDPYDTCSISNDFVRCIRERGDFLFIGTIGGGLNLYHKKTKRFYRFPAGLLSGSQIAAIELDGQGNVWLIAGGDFYIGYLNKITVTGENFWQQIPQDEKWAAKVKIEKWEDRLIRALCIVDGKLFCAGNGGDIFTVEAGGASWKKAVIPPSGIDDTRIFSMVKGRDDIWASRTKDLLQFSLRQPEAGWRSIASQDTLFSIPDTDRNGLLWLKYMEGAYAFPVEKARLQINKKEATWYISASGAYARCMTDSSGTIWIGTNGYGIQKFSPRKNRFRHYFAGQSVHGTPCMDREGNIAFFNYDAGFRFLRSSGMNHVLAALKTLKYPYGDGRIIQDKAGNFWTLCIISEEEAWLIKTDGANGVNKIYPFPVNENRGGYLTIDENGMVWIGMSGKFLRFDPQSEQFATHDCKHISQAPFYVYSSAKTPGNIWWLGTDLGLVRAVPAGQSFEFKMFKNNPGDRNSLRNNSVASLHTDTDNPGILWIGTKGGGLNRLDTRTMQFSHITTEDGLPDNVIYGILPDGAGNLWMSSNKGIIRYNPESRAIKYFTEEDGLQSDEFNTWAYAKAPSGELMFGGVNGLNVFRPEDLEDNPVVPRVWITRLFVNNQEIKVNDGSRLLTEAIEFTGEITLPFSQNNITLEFAALEYSAPAKNRYRYYLEGAEPEWVHEGVSHEAAYLNLPPGSYNFWVKGSNGDGIWNETPVKLRIHILPPWYRTRIAYLLYAILLAGGTFLVYKIKLRQKLEHAETLRLQELDAFKSRFFTNITHEFRTPLTVILGTAGQVEAQAGEAVKGKIGLIRRSGENLLRLINQLLDLAKLESGNLKINYVQGDIVAYLRYVTESLHSLANSKNVLLRMESTQPDFMMDYDPERLLQIVHNLLSNAIKFTPSGGRVTLRTAINHGDFKNHHDLKTFVITVSDTGPGILPENLPKVFDRFFQVENSATGSGIGLSLTSELVKALGGKISVESPVPGQTEAGTRFTVALPVKNEAAPFQHAVTLKEAPPDVLPAGKSFSGIPRPLSPNETPEAATSHILLIEDNPDVVEYLAACLGTRYQLDFAFNGQAGIEKAIDTIPDLIISDVMMPEKDGFEVCEFLKNDERTSHIPIILLTAKVNIESRLAGLRRGADVYLEKPFREEELDIWIEKLMARQQHFRQRYGNPVSPAGIPPAGEDEKMEDAFMLKIREVMEARFADPSFTVEQLCREMAMSRTQIHRKLTALTNRSTTEFMNAFRLEKARRLLLTTSLNVSQVAYDTGFNDPKYFSRLFSEYFKMPPSEVRNG